MHIVRNYYGDASTWAASSGGHPDRGRPGGRVLSVTVLPVAVLSVAVLSVAVLDVTVLPVAVAVVGGNR